MTEGSNINELSKIPLYDGEPLLFSKEPVVLKRAEASFIETTLKNILKNVEAFTSEAVKNPSTLKRLGLPQNLPPEPTPLGLHIPFARFDFVFADGNLKVLELNTDGTSGFNVTEWLAKEANIPEKENPNFGLSERLYHAIKRHDPHAPAIHLIDFPDVSTNWEQADLIRRWSHLGPVFRSSPSVRDWKPGALMYRRALSWQLRSQKERAAPFLQDWEQGKIKVVGGWSSDVGMSKAWLGILKIKEAPETEIIHRFMIKRLKEEKDSWIVKGALSFSGQAVLRGSDLTDEKWAVTLANVLSETEKDRPWIAQRRLTIPLVEKKPCEYGLFFLNGEPAGYMCRWGHSDVITAQSQEIFRPIRIRD